MTRAGLWRRRAARAAALGAALAALGAVVVASGVVPIKASSGHFAVTEWLLNFAKERSVATHSLFVDVALDEPWLVVKGAGHYEAGCLPCHGAPGRPLPAVAHAMTPHPPRLEVRARDYSPEELFTIVKHGIKFTGMPGWPAQSRDDEVRAVVAFLVRLPELDAASYDALVHGAAAGNDSRPPATLLAALPGTTTAACARCHGADGEGRGTAAFPKLAGQRADYLYQALVAYREGERPSGTMGPIAIGMREDELRAAADHYAAQPVAKAPALDAQTRAGAVAERGDPSEIARGRDIATRGIPARRVPPCAQCHDGARSSAYPTLAWQYADYLELQLSLFKHDRRGGAPFSKLMRLPAHGLEADEARAVSRYYAAGAPAQR